MIAKIVDRVEFEGGKLDEIVAARGAHLERIGKNDWFLAFFHDDGTETAIWFTSKDLKTPYFETRKPSNAPTT
jgi:hypothetical protein